MSSAPTRRLSAVRHEAPLKERCEGVLPRAGTRTGWPATESCANERGFVPGLGFGVQGLGFRCLV